MKATTELFPDITPSSIAKLIELLSEILMKDINQLKETFRIILTQLSEFV